MSFDIYGQNLRRGYCEVHPDVHEEYPCSVCIAEKKRVAEQERQMYEAGMQEQHISALEARLATCLENHRLAREQNDHLMGVVERNKKRIIHCDNCGSSWYDDGWIGSCPKCAHAETLKNLEQVREALKDIASIGIPLTADDAYEMARIASKALTELEPTHD